MDSITVRCTEFKRFEKNTLRGFAKLEIPGWGVSICDITLHTKNGSTWVGLPAKRYSKKDGTEGWQPTVEFLDDAAKRAFQSAAVAAIERFIQGKA